MARYLTAQEILVLHALVIDETGGSHGVRDIGLLASVAMRPQLTIGGVEMFPDLFLKAAGYFESLTHYHLFVDGNKRTALTATARFLAQNGYELTATNAQAEAFTLKVVLEKPGIETIAAWLRRHCAKDARRRRDR